jgi:hypothetical protein
MLTTHLQESASRRSASAAHQTVLSIPRAERARPLLLEAIGMIQEGFGNVDGRSWEHGSQRAQVAGDGMQFPEALIAPLGWLKVDMFHGKELTNGIN